MHPINSFFIYVNIKILNTKFAKVTLHKWGSTVFYIKMISFIDCIIKNQYLINYKTYLSQKVNFLDISLLHLSSDMSLEPFLLRKYVHMSIIHRHNLISC